MKLYVLTRERTIYHRTEDDFLDKINCDIVGIFDEIEKVRDMVNKLILRTIKIVGKEKIISESLTTICYYGQNDDEFNVEYKVTMIDKLNVEL